MNYPKISIVTPSYNQAKYLEEAILSIVSQGYPNLEYIIIDGGSTDDSVDIIKKYESHLTFWVSEPDRGLYYALQKGFDKSTGEIMGWLNSDDLLHQKSLFVLADVFQHIPEVNWLQGHPNVFDEMGRVVYNRMHRASKYYFYSKHYHNGEFIQQESTYWRRSVWEKAGTYISQQYKYAGDFELWMRFFRYEQLYCTHALIGGFRMRASGQLSSVNYNAYLKEADTIIECELSDATLKQVKQLVERISVYKRYFSKIPFLNLLFKKYILPEKESNCIYFDFTKQQFRK